jgi:hypothetical protein
MRYNILIEYFDGKYGMTLFSGQDFDNWDDIFFSAWDYEGNELGDTIKGKRLKWSNPATESTQMDVYNLLLKTKHLFKILDYKQDKKKEIWSFFRQFKIQKALKK